MRRLTGMMLVVAVGSAALGGCALRDPRDHYGYGRGTDGLWESSFELIDWNFPTSVNQGPVVRPERLVLEPTAIGVTWATRNPIPINEQEPAQDAPSPASADEHSPSPASADETTAPGAAPTPARADAEPAAARERDGAR